MHEINSRNFRQWSQPVKLFIKGKGEVGLLDGQERYQIHDYAIAHYSIEPDISQSYLFFTTARDLWKL